MFSRIISILFFKLQSSIKIDFKNNEYYFQLGNPEKHSLGNFYYFEKDNLKFQLNFSKNTQKMDLVFSAYFKNKLLYRKLYTSINNWTIDFEEILLESMDECNENFQYEENLIELITDTIEYTVTGFKYLDGYDKIQVIQDNDDKKKMFLVITKLNKDEVIIELLYFLNKLWFKNIHNEYPRPLNVNNLIQNIFLKCDKSDYPMQGQFYLSRYSSSSQKSDDKLVVLNIFENNYSSESIYKFYQYTDENNSMFIYKDSKEIQNFLNKPLSELQLSTYKSSYEQSFTSFTDEILHFLKRNMPNYEYIESMEFTIPLNDDQVEYIEMMNY